jgi:hypothetical protein
MTLNGVNSSEDPATGIVKQFTIPVLYGVQDSRVDSEREGDAGR